MKYFVFIFRQWIDHGFYLFSCSGNGLIMDFVCYHVRAMDWSWILYVFMFRQWIDHGYWYDKKDSSRVNYLPKYIINGITLFTSVCRLRTSELEIYMNTSASSNFQSGLISTEVIFWNILKCFDFELIL